uniref:Uncharacterized protein n=1 Tax=Arundo donax TaxID=35708 RepID=A0A0A9EKB1_ARUDO
MSNGDKYHDLSSESWNAWLPYQKQKNKGSSLMRPTSKLWCNSTKSEF